MGNKDLEVKYLFLKDLASLALRISAFGAPLVLLDRRRTPLLRNQKVNIDKTEARRAVLFFRHDSLGYDGDGHSSPLLTGHVTFSRRWGWNVCAGGHGAGVMKEGRSTRIMESLRRV